MKSSFRLGSIGGIEIGVHFSWLFIFALITWSLADSFYPDRYAGWTTATYWFLGAVSAIMLFVSVLIHELAHSFVAKTRGIEVQGITLFLFGGVSNLKSESKSARDEFAISIVGPLTSAGLAVAFLVIRLLVADSNAPGAAILDYLWFVNAAVAVFNILPGFPLDGGRVLRSIIWGRTGSLVRATNVASFVGQSFGWALILVGVYLLLAADLFSGLWFAFIGWFLNSAAAATRRDLLMREAMSDVHVRQLMDSEPTMVSPDLTVDELVRGYFLRLGLRAAPVSTFERLVGFVSLTDVKKVPQEAWPTTRVDAIMTTGHIYDVSPDSTLSDALALMGERDINQLLVREGDALVGMLNRASVLRYLQSMKELGIGRLGR